LIISVQIRIDNTSFRTSDRVLATTKIATEMWIDAQGRESTIGSNFNGERASCGKFKIVTIRRWDFVTSSIMLKPPVFLSEHMLGSDRQVIVPIICPRKSLYNNNIKLKKKQILYKELVIVYILSNSTCLWTRRLDELQESIL
jgi:hypothetical protein